MTGRTVVLLAHGSADPRHAADIEALADRVRQRLDEHVVTAYLDHNPPSVGLVARALAPGTEVVLVPLLLTDGYHLRVDVPRAAGELSAGHRVTVTAALGPDPAVDEAVAELGRRGAGPTVAVRPCASPEEVTALPSGDEQVVVAQVLARGTLRDRIAQRCHEQGLRLADGALATTEALTRLVVRRVTDAAGL